MVNFKRFFRKLKNRKRKKRKNFSYGGFIKSFNFSIQRIFIFGGVIFLSIVIYRFVMVQVDELKHLNFLNNQKFSFEDSVDVPRFVKDSPFTLILVVGEGESKNFVNHISLLHVDPVAESAFIISLPHDLWLDFYTPYGYENVVVGDDFVKVKDLMLIGDLMNPPRQMAYTIFSIEELLALDIDAYVYFPEDMLVGLNNLGNGYSILVDDNIGSFSEQSVNLSIDWIDYLDSVSLTKIWMNRDVVPKISSNMSPVDLYSFIKEFSNIKEDDLHVIEFSEEFISEEINSKGDRIFVLKSDSIDEALKGISKDEKIEKEQARVEIFNGSGINGLGNRYSRWIRHLGADVIRVENASGEWAKTVIYVTDEEEYKYSLSRIKSIWNDDVEVRIGRPDFVSTGDIIVVLGLDI